jgi:copper chaperone CopZ
MVKDATFKVPDMSRSHCKVAVEVGLNGLPGVVHSDADVGRGIVEVSYDESKLGTERLEGAIEEAGYTVAD